MPYALKVDGLPYLPQANCTELPILREMWGAVSRLPLVQDLRSYCLTSTIPGLNLTIVPAIDYFREYKGRNRKKINEHLGNNYGPKLELTDRFDRQPLDLEYHHDLYLGLRWYIQENIPPITRDIRGLAQFGVKDFRELAYDMVALMQAYWAKR